MNLAPVCLFTFKRLDTTIQTVEALKKNTYASETEIFVFTDGPRPHKEGEVEAVEKVKEYIHTITGFKQVHMKFRSVNLGLANSIISGVTEVMNQYGKAIVLEDDLITTSNYLAFMNHALDFYEKNQKIFSIGGYTIHVKLPKNYPYDVYAVPRATPWGWGSWKDRWDTIDWEVRLFDKFKNDSAMRSRFNEGGSDLSKMLIQQMTNQLDSWAIRWIFQQFVNQQYTIFPVISKIRNIGFGEDATHTKFYDRYRSTLDQTNKIDFKFMEDVVLEQKIVNSYKDKYSLTRRLTGRLKFYLGIP